MKRNKHIKTMLNCCLRIFPATPSLQESISSASRCPKVSLWEEMFVVIHRCTLARISGNYYT